MKRKLFGIFKRKKKKDPNVTAIPTEWLEKPLAEKLPKGTEALLIIREKGPKIHVWGLRTAKRVLAFGLLVFSVFFALGSLVTAYATVLTLFFLLNAFINFDYLWKTRKKRKYEG